MTDSSARGDGEREADEIRNMHDVRIRYMTLSGSEGRGVLIGNILRSSTVQCCVRLKVMRFACRQVALHGVCLARSPISIRGARCSLPRHSDCLDASNPSLVPQCGG